VVAMVPEVGVTVSQFPSEVTAADVKSTVPLEVEMKTGTSDIPWPGSVQKTTEEGLNVTVLVCALAGTAEARAIRATASRGLLKDFSRRESTAQTSGCDTN
jgi:hypothetical protein